MTSSPERRRGWRTAAPLALVLATSMAALAAAADVREVARVNGVPITADRVDRALNALVPMETFHRSIKADKLAELRAKALRNVIEEELRYQDAKQRGIAASASEIDAAIAAARKRYTTVQAFDEAQRRAGVTPTQLRGEVARAIVVQKAYDRTVTDACQVSAADSERYFREHPDRFVVPEQLHVYAITIGVDPSSTPKQWDEARVRAGDVVKKLRAGAAFDAMARAYSTDKSKDTGGDMGFVHRGSLTDAFEKTLRPMKPGQVSDVVQSLYGFHIVRLAEVKPPQAQTFSEVSARLRTDLTSTRCVELSDAWTARLRARASIVIPQP